MGQIRKDTSQNHNVEQKKAHAKEQIPYCMVSIMQCSKTSPVIEIETIAVYWRRIIIREAFRVEILF